MRQFFVKATDIQNAGKMFYCGKLLIIIVNFTLLWDIDNRKRTSEWGASYLIHFFPGQPPFLFYQKLVTL